MFFNGLAECDEDILPLCTVYEKLICLGGCGSKVLGLAIIHVICCWPEIILVEAIFWQSSFKESLRSPEWD